MTTPGTTVSVRFEGGRGGEAPLTWAQRFMYDVVESLRGQDTHLNFHIRADVPAGASTEAVGAAVRTLVERNEVLRTRFHPGPDGEPVQTVLPSGTVEIGLVDGVGPDGVEDFCAAVRFADHEWPLRVSLLCDDDEPRHLVVTVGHAAVDQWAAALLGDQLTALLAGDALSAPPEGEQPLDRARFEGSPEGEQLRERTLGHLEAQLRAAQQTLFPAASRAPESPRYWIGELDSPLGGIAIRKAARRLRVPATAVLLGLFAIFVGERGRTGAPLMLIIAGNRHTEAAMRYVGQLAQFTATTVPVDPDSVAATVRAASRGLLESYSFGQYPTLELERLVETVGTRRGVALDLTTTLNVHHSDADMSPVSDEAFAEAVAKYADATTFGWLSKLEVENYKLYLDARVDDRLHLWLRTDTAVISPAGTEALLRGMEHAMVRLATGDLKVEELMAQTGAPASRPASGDERVVDHSLVDLRDCLRLVTDATGAPAAVSVEDGDRLTAWVAPADPATVTPQSLHAACMAALPGRRTAMAPQHYVVCAEPPADPADLGQWRALPVVASATGR
nr:hypothetical protein GCM10020063_007790 [Dactylosporangium thailandense]